MTYQISVSEPEQEPELQTQPELQPEPELQTQPEPELESRLRRIVHLTIDIPTEIIQPFITGIRRNSDIVELVSMF